MSNITKEFIEQCALKLGRFDDETVNLLVILFRHQNTCSRLVALSNNLKENFENLLSAKIDNNVYISDIPITRIELATMIQFKEKYLSELIVGDHDKFKLSSTFSIEDELNLSYCFLLAQIDDYLSHEMLNAIKFIFNVRQPVTCLFDIYTSLGSHFSNFFSSLLDSKCFAQKLVVADRAILDFQPFIKNYKDFLITFEQHYKPYIGNDLTQPNAIIKQDNPDGFSTSMMNVNDSNHGKLRTSISMPVSKIAATSVRCEPIQRILKSSAASNVPEKGLCVIINIKKLTSSDAIEKTERAGSHKDVELIKLIFTKLKFTILECKFDFKKNDLDGALDCIDDQDKFRDFDCLVMFIMSHGLLHSLFTADLKEVIIRDIVKRYSDSSATTIWTRKPRLFFIQACRSPWPENMQSPERAEVQIKDLSPRMLVAYSCSAKEESKRCTKTGSYFIQMFCIMLFRYAHYLDIQTILQWTAKFVIKRNECSIQHSRILTNIQRPEYIEREFSTKFRFSNNSLKDSYDSWSIKEQIVLNIPLFIWNEIYNLMLKN